MTNFLLIIIAIMVFVTMVCAIITTIIEVKNEHAQDLVKKALKVTGIALLVAAVIGASVGISYVKGDNNSENKKVTLQTAGFNEVSIEEYLTLIKEEEKNVILIARPTCGFCEQFTPVLKEATDDLKITVNYVDTDKFSNEDWNTFNSSFEYLKTTEWGTPLILVTENGKLVAENQGYTELDTIKEFFKDNGIGE